MDCRGNIRDRNPLHIFAFDKGNCVFYIIVRHAHFIFVIFAMVFMQSKDPKQLRRQKKLVIICTILVKAEQKSKNPLQFRFVQEREAPATGSDACLFQIFRSLFPVEQNPIVLPIRCIRVIAHMKPLLRFGRHQKSDRTGDRFVIKRSRSGQDKMQGIQIPFHAQCMASRQDAVPHRMNADIFAKGKVLGNHNAGLIREIGTKVHFASSDSKNVIMPFRPLLYHTSVRYASANQKAAPYYIP